MAIPLGALLAIVGVRFVPPLLRTPVLERMAAVARPAGSGLDAAPDPHADPAGFASFVAASANGFWRSQFPALGLAYRAPMLHIFGDATSLPCFPLMDFGDGPPYYCFLDDTISLPQQYISDLAAAPGVSATVAVAYSVAHEIAHHVQHLTGLGATVEYREAKPGAAARRALVAYELQADCLAGLWLATVLPSQAVDQAALAGAQRVAIEIHGPEGGAALDTHGTLEQRQQALWRGFRTGRGSSCQAL